MSLCQDRNYYLRTKPSNQYVKYFRFTKTVLMGDMQSFINTLNSLIPTVMQNISWNSEYGFYWNFDLSPTFDPTTDEYAGGGRSADIIISSVPSIGPSYWVPGGSQSGDDPAPSGIEYVSPPATDGFSPTYEYIAEMKVGCVAWYLFPNYPVGSFSASVYKRYIAGSVLALPQFFGISGNSYALPIPDQFFSLASQIAPTVDIDGTHSGTQIQMALPDSAGMVTYYPGGRSGSWNIVGLGIFSEERLLKLAAGNQAAGAGGTGSAGGGVGSGSGAGGGAGGGFDDQL
jgi:hypothetical protein